MRDKDKDKGGCAIKEEGEEKKKRKKRKRGSAVMREKRRGGIDEKKKKKKSQINSIVPMQVPNMSTSDTSKNS